MKPLELKSGKQLAFLKEKWKKLAKYLELTDFKGSPGCISSAIKHDNIEIINLHGEDDYMSE